MITECEKLTCSECGCDLPDPPFRHRISIFDRVQWFCRTCWMSGVAKNLFTSLMQNPDTGPTHDL